MDYSRLRATALREGEAEEAVTVDTRALIDKVLARYSGEWTTLRELIQNAADAQATTVKIKWETLPSTTVPLPSGADVNGGEHASSTLLGHTIMHHTLRRLLVENDGQPFAPTDWARLKRIAEGNPDETKIGAFGVGFYSVFADCEEPFVSSGNEAMAFYWKGNALFTRKLVLPEDQRSPTGATTFVLDYRNATTALPNLLSVSQFLASSLTFVALQHIEFWIDDWKILELHKTMSPSTAVPIPRDLTTRTKDNLMTVTAVEWSSAQIDAVYMNAVGWKPPAAGTLASGTSNASAASNKNTDSYGLSAADMPSLRSFFSRLTSSASASASALASQRSKAAREEKAAQDALQQNLTGQEKASITLRVTTAQVKTRVAATFATELERATKKPPPKMTKMAILTSSYDDVVSADPSASKTAASKTDVFASVLPAKKPGGRIFIGFPTMQTTGGGLHVSAPSLIPTVEREAIDLNARWVRNWNMELLRASGILTRLAYINEMADFGRKFQKHLEASRPPPAPGVKASSKLPIPTAADLTKFVPEALHILKTYTFGDSTPSAYVGQIIEEAFWTAYTVPTVDIFSTRGVLPTTTVRMGDEKISQFVDGIPVVVPEMKESPFIQKLHDFGILHDVTIDDVRSELESKPLGKDQLSYFVKWMGDCAMSGELDPPSVRVLLQAAVASIVTEEDEGAAIIELGTISNFLSGNKIPASLPLPPSTIPYSITSNIPHAKLQALGWTPLELVPWMEYLLSARTKLGQDKDMTKSPAFAAQVLMVLSKNWDNLATAHRALVLSKLQNTTSIPTKMGMKRPPDAFFPSVKLFDDLPTLSPSCHGLKEKFLVALGVRKTIDLDTIFTRLLSQPATAAAAAAADSKDGKGQEGKKWSHVELAKYLASVRSDIPSKDFNKLLESPICPAEAGPAGKEWTVPSTKLYRANQLFEPSDAVRELKFPVMQWPGPPGSFRRNSPEGAFLISLGLRRTPSVLELLTKMASSDRDLREKARAYYIANHQTNGYASYSISSADHAILPVERARGSEKQQEEQLVKPSACFINSQAAILGFAILRADLQPHANKFGVAQNPPMDECVKRLVLNPPRNHQDAVTVFEYFSSRLTDVHGESLRRLQQAKIVPVSRQGGWADEKRRSTSSAAAAAAATSVQHIKPNACYLGSSTTYGDIFDFVDFGRNANAFLFQCGSKTEPTKVELARQACKEPARLLSTLQTPERYLNLLRSLAEDLPRLKQDKELFAQMQVAPFLLASKEVSHVQSHHRQSSTATTTTTGGGGDAEDEAPVRQFQLASASKIAIVDDYISYRLFKDKLVCAPEEDVLETFYLALGAQFLSSIVQEEIQIGRHSADQSQAEALRKYVLERSKIFLYEYQKYRQDAIRHDHRWLEKHLKVEMVQSVALRRSVRSVGSSGGFGGSFGGNYGETHTEKRSAASSRQLSGHMLYISSQGPVDMYQVGQAVCQVVLNRPSQQAYFFFEPFLKLELLDLRARGYNVDRILRAKQAEARLAEEERRRALEAEQQHAEQRRERGREAGRSEKGKLEKEAEYAQQTPQMLAARNPPRARTPEPHMPGAFGDEGSPDRQQTQNQQNQQQQYQQHQQQLQDMVTAGTKRGKDLFSNLTRRLGLDQGSESPSGSGTNRGTAGTSGSGGAGGQVASPEAVQQDMQNAIQSSRPYGSSTLFQLPSQPTVQEQATYCDSTQAHDLQWVARAAGGMAVYLSRDLAVGGSAVELLNAQRPAIAVFETLLRDVAAVYGLSTTVLHIYYDSEGPTIAFNSGGSIFCNLRFFVQLHAATMLSSGPAQAQGRVDAAVWWWVVLAHELAHNLEPIHNSRHSFYTESFVQQYFHAMTSRAAAWTSGPDDLSPAQRQDSAPPSYQQALQGGQRRSLLD